MSSLPALLLYSACLAHAAEPPVIPSDSVSSQEASLRKEMEQGRDTLQQELDRLARLRERYGAPAALKEVEPERTELRKRLKEGKDGLYQTYETYRGLSMQGHLLSLGQFLAGGRPDGLNEKARDAMVKEKFAREIRSFCGDIDLALQKDEGVFEGAKKAFERRRIMNFLIALLAAAALASIFLMRHFWIRAVVPAASLPTGAPTLPPPQAALLSAPAAAGQPPGPETAAGSVIGGNFQVVRELGRGGMGLVYEALDMTLQRKVALKRLRDELMQNPKDLEQLLSEARLVASLKHPNIVEIHGVVNQDGRIYLVFEHIAGLPLDRFVEEKGRLPLSSVRAILTHAGAALDYAHSRRVIHRDLKPSNIMLTDDRRVKVMDFGLAHRARATAARVSRAEPWGSLAYMAPEQEIGTVSRESDLYSLGTCAYEMAVGKPPFPGPNFTVQKREMRYIPPSKAAGLGPAFDAFIARALQADPALRFHSAAEMVTALGTAAGA